MVKKTKELLSKQATELAKRADEHEEFINKVVTLFPISVLFFEVFRSFFCVGCLFRSDDLSAGLVELSLCGCIYADYILCRSCFLWNILLLAGFK